MELYTQILDNGGVAFSEILKHVRDKPEESCLFHCTGWLSLLMLNPELTLTATYL